MLNNAISVILVIVILLSSAVSVHAIPPREKAWSTTPVLKDQLGRDLVYAGAGELALVESVLTSNMNSNQTFAYIVQIKNAQEITVQLSWLDGMLEPMQKFRASQSWVPPEEGSYIVEIFVWSSVGDPDPLGPMQTGEFLVHPNSKPIQFDFDFTISVDPESLIIQRGKNEEITVTVERVGKDNSDVLLLSTAPLGITVSAGQDFRDNKPPYSIPVTISVSNSTPVGIYEFDIVGESGTLQHSVTVKVMIVREDL
ncbi:MAG: hypothetical protein ACRD5H_11910 [Nitrososphaerales archaeon]